MARKQGLESHDAARLRRALIALAAVAIIGASSLPLADHLRGAGNGAVWNRWIERRAIVAAFIPYLVALLVAVRRPPSRRTILAVAALASVPLLAVLAVGSHDVFSYLFYGRMLAHAHVNPLAVPPSVLASDRWYHLVGWQHTPSVYGPLWTYVCAAASAVWPHILPGVLIVKALSIAGAVTGCMLAARLAGESAESRNRALLFMLWNPLLLFSIAGDGHVDGVLIGLIVGALVARRRDRMATTTVLLIAATLIKAYCGIFLVLHIAGLVLERRRTFRDAALHAGAVVAAFAALYAPLWARRSTFTGLATVAGFFGGTIPALVRDATATVLRHSGDGAQHALLEGADVARIFSAVTMAALLAVLLIRAGRSGRETWLWGAAFAGYILVATWFMPWHALPLVPLAVLQGRRRTMAAFIAGVLALGVTGLYAVPLVRFGVPLLVAFVVWRLDPLWAGRQQRGIAA